MKITFLDSSTLGDDISLSRFEELAEVDIYETTRSDETLERVKDADIVVTNKVVIDREIMQKSSIKLICVAATGMNNIDLDSAKELGIEVKNVAGYSTSSVVQLTFALSLYLINEIGYFDEYTKSGRWCESEIFTHLGRSFFDINGKTWGIIGLGAIGKEVAKIATAFGCEVIYYSTSGKNSDVSYKRAELEELLKESDIVSIHAPLNENTTALIDMNRLKLLKRGAVILNLGRGGIIVEEDLANFIDSSDIKVALDVIESEPMRDDNPLLRVKAKDRLLITPHIAWASRESREKLVDGIYENIINFIGEKR
jgi:glycerate dehydrogenase